MISVSCSLRVLIAGRLFLGLSKPDKQPPLCAVFLLCRSLNLYCTPTLKCMPGPISEVCWEIAVSVLKHISCLYVPCRTEFVWITISRKYVSTGIHGQLKYFTSPLDSAASASSTRASPACPCYFAHKRRWYTRSNAITLSQSVFTVQTVIDCVGRLQRAEPCAQCAATTVSDPVKHVRNQGSFKSDWFTAFIAL